MSQFMLPLPEPTPTSPKAQMAAPAPPAAQTPPALAVSAPCSPAPRTIAEGILAVRGFADLSEHRRKTIISSLRAIVRLAGKPAEAVRLDAIESVALLEQASTATLGVREETLANYRTGLRQALRRFGYLAPERVHTQQADHPAWSALLERLPESRDFLRLKSFVGFCAHAEIGPAEVGNATLEAYREYRATTRGGAKSGDHVRRVASQWNRAASDIPAWPATRLGVTGRTLHQSLPFDAYLPRLQEEIVQYLTAIGVPKSGRLFTGAPHTPVKPATVDSHKYNLRRLLWGALQGGMEIAEIDSLHVITSERFVTTSLEWHHDKAGGQVTNDLGNLARTIASVARYQALPEKEWVELKQLLKAARPKSRTEMTERNTELLDKLDDPTIRLALLHSPLYILRRAARLQSGWRDRKGVFHEPRPLDAAWLASLAVAVEILLNAPLRIADLRVVKVGAGLTIASRGRGRWSGTISVVAQKNDKRVEFPLEDETISLVREYLEKYRPMLPNADTSWLFPGQASAGEPRNKSSFGTAITEVVHEFVGTRVNPHAFRAFAGALILERNPHAIDDVRAVLGHSSFEIALRFYRRNSTREAAKRLSGTIKQERRKTKLQAEAHFHDLDRTMKTSRTPWKN